MSGLGVARAGDHIEDRTGRNIGIEGGVTLNFSFDFDLSTDTVVGNPVFTATGNPALVADLNLSELRFQSDPASPAGAVSIDFAGPALGGGTTTLSLGPNGLSENPGEPRSCCSMAGRWASREK